MMRLKDIEQKLSISKKTVIDFIKLGQLKARQDNFGLRQYHVDEKDFIDFQFSEFWENWKHKNKRKIISERKWNCIKYDRCLDEYAKNDKILVCQDCKETRRIGL